jgi:hypothetical protein
MQLDRETIRNYFSASDFQKGVAYYRQGRVCGLRRWNEHGETSIRCTVRGSKDYAVEIDVLEHGMDGWCSCPRFAATSTCKHLVAALLAAAQSSTAAVTANCQDPDAARLLECYRRQAQDRTAAGEPARLVPRISLSAWNDYPTVSFQVGYDKLYVVKNIREFLLRFQNGQAFEYGKNLTLCHRLENFDDRSQQLIRLLMDQYRELRSFQIQSFSYYAEDYGKAKNEVQLTGMGFDRLFSLLEGQNILRQDGRGTVLFASHDPAVHVQLTAEAGGVRMEVPEAEDLTFFGNSRSLYAVEGDQVLLCSADFQEKVYPMLQNRSALSVWFSEDDMTSFCSYILPEIEPLVTVEEDVDLLSRYLPDTGTPCFYFDSEEDCLTVQLRFRYGDRELLGSGTSSVQDGIHRDLRTEERAVDLVRRVFPEEAEETATWCLRGEEETYTFLTTQLAQFQAAGEVYISDRLRSMQVPQSKVSLGISVSDGLLQLDLDTGEFPAAELEDLYQSLLLRRKYHRLRDGRYLTLDGSAYETMAELAHIAQLTPQELADGKATMPAFRALYLDSVVGGNENIEVRRNNQFRAMVRQFKTVGDNDYEIPAAQRAVLRPYQKLGFRWLKTLESCHFGGILADDMGLGKTLQMITYFASVYLDQTLPSLIVCPASLVFNWADEFARFAPDLPVRLITGTAAERREALAQPLAGTILVTSYDLLKRDVELYRPVEFYCCTLDEGQFIKNQSTQASKAVKQINCRQRYVLTGTPIENRLSELWNLFDFLMPGYLFTHNRFVEKLEKPIAKKGDEVARQQLAKLVKPFILRRLKGDVLKELPPKMERDWRIQLSEEERKVYLAAVHAIRHGEVGGKLEILTALTRLRQICCDPGLCYENYEGPTSKLDACVDLCSTLAENGHQILLFSQFTSMLDRLRERLETAHITTFTLQGSTPKEKRAQLVKQFNSGGAQVFLISLKAGGTGLNLTAADVVIHYDPWWNRAVQDQATDRAHRIGQQASVQVYKLIAKDTIEEKIQELQQRKTALMDVLDQDGSADLASLSREELLELLEI